MRNLMNRMLPKANKPKTPTPTDPPKSPTMMVEQSIRDGDDYQKTRDQYQGSLINLKVGEYFAELLKTQGMTSSTAVHNANMDRNYGRDVLKGAASTTRENYICLAIGMGLSFAQTQSMLKFMQKGSIYVMRQRDAAIMYSLDNHMSYTETQLLLEKHHLPLLGEPDDAISLDPPGKRPSIITAEIEQIIRESNTFEQVTDRAKTLFVESDVKMYFDALLEARGMSRKQLIEAIGVNANTGYQLLNGERRAKNRDIYIRMVFALGLNLNETQRMLRRVGQGDLYAMVERDFALIYCIERGFTLQQAEAFLNGENLPPLA